MSALDEARKEKVMNAMEHTKAFIAAVAEFDADRVRAAAELFKERTGGSVAGLGDANGRTPLHMAAQRGDPSIIRVLVKDANVPVDAKDKDGATPLMAAADYGKPDAVKSLLTLGADPNAKSNNGTRAVHRAAGSAMGSGPSGDKASIDCAKCVKQLIEALEGGVDDTVGLESTADDGATPFLMACSRGSEATVELLAGKGANAAATLKSGVGAASLAAASGNPAALRAALRHGAPTGSRPSGGMSALHIAASHPNTAEHSLELVQALLEAKADADVADSEGLKAVHAAAAVGRTNVVEALIGATCPDDGVDAKDWNASSVQKTVQAKLRAMGAPRAEDVGITAEGAAAAAKQISETCVPHDVPTEAKDAAVAAKTKREGDEAFIKGDNVNAIDKYTQSLDADGTNEKVWANRAAAKLKLKDFHGALRDARTAKVIDCDYVKAWFREGSALTELGDYENAALCFFEGMQVEGQSENPDLKRGFDDAIKKGRDALGKK